MIVTHRLLNLGWSIHHKGAVTCHWLIEGLSSQKEHRELAACGGIADGGNISCIFKQHQLICTCGRLLLLATKGTGTLYHISKGGIALGDRDLHSGTGLEAQMQVGDGDDCIDLGCDTK